MTKILLSLFIKGAKNPADPKTRSAVGILSSIVGIVCNLLLFAAKLAIGTLAGSVSITADAMNNLSDATSAIVTLVGFKLAEKPADADHPYGHARYEYLSGLAVAALIIVIGVELGRSSLEKIFNPEAVSFSWVVALTLVLSIGVKLWLSLFNGKLSKLISSSTLAATAQDSRNDVISTAAVLVAAVIEYFTQFSIDGYMGLAVSAFILYSGAMLAKETISPLLGESASPELQALIVDYIQSQPKVLGFHDLMVHDYGPGQRFATLHVEMDKGEDPLLCHELIDDMERECLKEHNVHLVIHYDPVITDDPEILRLQEAVTSLLKQMDERMQIHDFRVVKGSGHTNLVFDIVLPLDLSSRKKEIQLHLEQTLSAQEKSTIYTVITYDMMAFNEGF